MNRITLSWVHWRAVIAVLRATALPSMRERAAHIERLLKQHGLDGDASPHRADGLT